MKISRRKFIAHSAVGSLTIPLAKANLLTDYQIDLPTKNSHQTMAFLFLGSGAADWDTGKYPIDKQVLLSGAYRGQSSILVNSQILIDCGETVPKALDIFNIDIDKITDIVITHTHGDHFNVESLQKIQSQKKKPNKMNLWIEYNAASYFKTLERDSGCIVHPVRCFEKFSINGIEITPVEANHQAKTKEQCLHYIFTIGDKSFLYALDGGWLTIRTWNLLKKRKLDAIIWDATWGADDSHCIFSHNSTSSIHLMKKQLFRDQVLNAESKIILSHLAQNFHIRHENLVKNMEAEMIITAYDGAEYSI